MIKGFRDFILRGNVMDLAVAVIIGAAFTAIVTALTEKIINPLLGAVIGKPNFGYLVGHINGGEIRYGDFLTAIVNFLLLAAVVYFFLVTAHPIPPEKVQPPAVPPATKPCPQCLSDIPVAATRCKFCTQPVNHLYNDRKFTRLTTPGGSPHRAPLEVVQAVAVKAFTSSCVLCRPIVSFTQINIFPSTTGRT